MSNESKGNNKASTAKLNWLRASVLGANDGIVSTASLIVGVAGATTSKGTIFTAGLAGLVAGALSMAVGEYVSVSSQRDTERAYIEKEKLELANNPTQEFEELAGIYKNKGLSTKTAHLVARELTDTDAIKAHLEAELKLDEEDLTNPTHAAVASMLAFTVGALIPLLSVVFTTQNLRLPVTFVAVVVALFITGFASATVGGASRRRAVLRVVAGGIIAMVVTFGIGRLFGTAVA
ncbi:MAG: VIT family protein [Candidatus Saccharimonadales bacterium]